MNVKIRLCRRGSVGVATVKYAGIGKGFWYLLFAVLLQVVPCTTKAASPVPRYKMLEFRDSAVDVMQDGGEFGGTLRTPMRSRHWNVINGASNSGTECPGGCGSSGITVILSAEIIRQERKTDGGNNAPTVVESRMDQIIKKIFHGILFGLPFAVFIFWLSTPTDPWEECRTRT